MEAYTDEGAEMIKKAMKSMIQNPDSYVNHNHPLPFGFLEIRKDRLISEIWFVAQDGDEFLLATINDEGAVSYV